MSLKFKPEDFKPIPFDNNGWREPNFTETIAQANAFFDKWLEIQPVLYGVSRFGRLVFNGVQTNEDTHTARLVDIQPIKAKCEHPAEKIKLVHTAMYAKSYTDRNNHIADYQCECGARVSPSKFKEVKE